MRRADKEITDRNEIEDILKGQKVLRLGLCDGEMPYVVPLSFGYDGESIFIHSAKEGRKIDMIRKNPRVCFEIDCDYVPTSAEDACRKPTKYRSLIGTGLAELLDDKNEKIVGLNALMVQHYGRSDGAYDQTKLDKLLMIRIKILSISCKRSGY